MVPDSYFDRFSTKKYRSRNPLQRLLIRRFVERLHSLFIAGGPHRRVLEIGCGEGFLSGYLSEKFPEKSFTGVDLDEADIAELKRKFPTVQAHQGSAYDLSFLEPGFDLVMCCEVLEHLEDYPRALGEMLRLEPRHLLLTVPNEPWFMLSNLLRGKNLTRLGNDLEHVNHWGPRSFERMLDEATGGRVEVIERTTAYPWLLALCRPR